MRTVLTIVKQRPAEADRDVARSGEPLTVENDYLLGERLGRGGMADVWAGHRCTDGCPVAIKILHPELSDLHERLEREAEVLDLLPSGCAPALFACGCSESGESCLVMERLYGQDLCRRLSRRGALPPREALAIVTRVAHILDVVHELGVVHRDLKPSNVFLCDAANDALCVRVLDFGIALRRGRSDEPPTRNGEFVGSPGYLAPEQVMDNGREIGPHTDVFGLAVLAYRLFTGHRAFHTCRTHAEAAFQAAFVDPAPASGVCRQLPPALDAVLASALAKSWHERPAHATDLAMALTMALG